MRDKTLSFEAVKISMTQDKNGHILKLSVHPSDMPEEVMRDWVGQRYMIALVRLNDQDEPMSNNPAPEKKTDYPAEDILAVKLAGTLCSNIDFQGWLCVEGMADGISEEDAARAVRKYCGIASRKELKNNKEARKKLHSLRDEFAASLRLQR